MEREGGGFARWVEQERDEFEELSMPFAGSSALAKALTHPMIGGLAFRNQDLNSTNRLTLSSQNMQLFSTTMPTSWRRTYD